MKTLAERRRMATEILVYTITCAFCGDRFEASRCDARFCGSRCRARAWYHTVGKKQRARRKD